MGELTMFWLSAPAGFLGGVAGVLVRRWLSQGRHAAGVSVAELRGRLEAERPPLANCTKGVLQ